MPKMTVVVDPALCITAANCVGVSADLFQINEEGFAEVRNPATGETAYRMTLDLTPAQLELVQEAAESCPTRAITFEEGGGSVS
jgi:ferredoxin